MGNDNTVDVTISTHAELTALRAYCDPTAPLLWFKDPPTISRGSLSLIGGYAWRKKQRTT